MSESERKEVWRNHYLGLYDDGTHFRWSGFIGSMDVEEVKEMLTALLEQCPAALREAYVAGAKWSIITAWESDNAYASGEEAAEAEAARQYPDQKGGAK